MDFLNDICQYEILCNSIKKLVSKEIKSNLYLLCNLE